MRGGSRHRLLYHSGVQTWLDFEVEAAESIQCARNLPLDGVAARDVTR